MSPPLPESKVLKPRSPQIADENEWPVFTLNNVQLLDRFGEPTSLLQATKSTPVRVVGILEGAPSELRRSNVNFKRPITVSFDCTHYSYGIYDNGDIDIWAAGEAGWFLVQPGADQEGLFAEMRTAVRLFYHVADAYRANKKEAVDVVLKSFRKVSRLKAGEVQAFMLKHKRFFGIQMQRKAELGSWTGTHIYQFLRNSHPDAFETTTSTGTPKPANLSKTSTPSTSLKPAMSKRVVAEVQENSRRPVRAHGMNSRSAESNSRFGSARGMARYDNVTRNHGDLDDVDSGLAKAEGMRQAQVDLLWKVLQHEVRTDFPTPKYLTLSKAGLMVSRGLTLEHKDAVDYVLLHGKALSSKMERAHNRFKWLDTPLYLDIANKNIHHAKANRLRRLVIDLRDGIVESELEELSEVEDSADELAPSTPHQSKGGLRPPSGKKTGKRYSGKSKGKPKVKQSISVEDPNVIVIDDDDDDEDDDISIGSKRKASVHNEQPARKSRRIAEVETSSSETEEEAYEDGVDDQRDSDGLSGEDYTGASARSTNRLLTLNIESPSLVSRPSQDIQPTDPGDVWRCSHVGCMHAVYGASTALGADLITEHLGEHDAMIKLVKGEQGRTRLPVSNLLNLLKLRGMDGSMPEFQPPGLEGDASAGYTMPLATST